MYCYIRSTCMPNPCRQRSSWARIKLSIKIIQTTEVVARFLRRIDLARFLCVIWNYIQIQCKLSGYIALFNFQTTFSLLNWSFINSLDSLTNRSVSFNLAQVWDLSNFVLNFFQTFFISTTVVRFAAFCDVRFNISQFWNLSNLISNFFWKFFFAALPLTLAVFCGVRFNIPQIFNLSNFVLNFFQTFLSAPSPRAPARLATGL